MISRIDHVSIAVRDYEKARAFFQDLLGAVPGARARDEAMNYLWQIFSLGDLSRLELMTATGPDSFLDGFLKDREGGAHHITLQTPDLRGAKQALEDRGIPTFGHQEYGDFWKEFFVHPRDAFGVLLQFAEFRADDWLSDAVKFPAGVRWSVEGTEDGCRLRLAHPGGGKARLDLTAGQARQLVEDLNRALGA